MWRALDCAGAGDLERLMEGLLAAFDAGVHIISYSIGYNFPWNDPEVPDYKVFKRMTEHGIFGRLYKTFIMTSLLIMIL